MTYSQFVDQLYIECVLEDDLNSLIQDQSSNAIQKLEEIRDQLTACASSREELLDYYSQDKVFASIVKTSDRYNNLCNFIDDYNKKMEESNESYTGMVVAACAVYGLCVGLITSLMTDRGINGAYNLASFNSLKADTSTYNFNRRSSIYAIKYNDAISLCDAIDECMKHLKRWAQYPHIFNEDALIQVSKKLNIKQPDVLLSDKLTAGTKATIKGLIQSIGFGGGIGLTYGLIFGISGDPEALLLGLSSGAAATTGVAVHNIAANYKKELNKGARKTLQEQGWTDSNFKDFSKRVVVIIQNAQALYKTIKSNKAYFKSKEAFKQCKGFYTVMMIALKGLCKMYISMCYSAKKK